jgi:hypothetical protein
MKVKYLLSIGALMLSGGLFAQEIKQIKPRQKQQTVLTHQEAVAEYGFPELKNTGNPLKDNEIYRNEKLEWIKQNPELYKKMNTADNTPQITTGNRKRISQQQKNNSSK